LVIITEQRRDIWPKLYEREFIYAGNEEKL